MGDAKKVQGAGEKEREFKSSFLRGIYIDGQERLVVTSGGKQFFVSFLVLTQIL